MRPNGPEEVERDEIADRPGQQHGRQVGERGTDHAAGAADPSGPRDPARRSPCWSACCHDLSTRKDANSVSAEDTRLVSRTEARDVGVWPCR
jgi:hypothetical protein